VTPARTVALGDVEPIPLAGGSWSRLLIHEKTVDGTHTTLGYSVFRAGSRTDDLSHETDELAYVVSGHGSLQLDDKTLAVGEGDALFIPAGVWHTVAAGAAEDLTMVFTFPSPGYPPTERRPARL
jgi:quercetin dioxygenase-like cupin family protein